MAEQQIDWEKESRESTKSNNAQLGIVGELGMRAKHVEDEIKTLEKMLDDKRKELRDIVEGDLVAALDEAGIPSFELMDGSKIQIREDLYMSIPQKNKVEAANWLCQNGLGSLVKEDVVVHLQKGDPRADNLRKMLIARGFDSFDSAPAMNTTSVKAAVRKLLADGANVPLEMLGGYSRRWAKIT